MDKGLDTEGVDTGGGGGFVLLGAAAAAFLDAASLSVTGFFLGGRRSSSSSDDSDSAISELLGLLGVFRFGLTNWGLTGVTTWGAG